MAPGRSLWQAAAVALFLIVGPTAAQEPVVSLLTLDQDRLFGESAFGKALLQREQQATKALDEENALIEAELIAEEQELTARRRTLPAEEFAALATSFDDKVERIRTEQDAKARDLTLSRDAERKEFLRAAGPILGKLMSEKGAVAIMDKRTVVLALSAIDITDEAIARVDAELGSGKPAPDAP